MTSTGRTGTNHEEAFPSCGVGTVERRELRISQPMADVVFWDMTPCGSSKKNRHFDDRLHLKMDMTFESSQFTARAYIPTNSVEIEMEKHRV
jgi:hypothetical protein